MMDRSPSPSREDGGGREIHEGDFRELFELYQRSFRPAEHKATELGEISPGDMERPSNLCCAHSFGG